MKTEITTDPTVAAEVIKRGGIVAFPTETVYGLGANIFDTSAVARIFEAKMRPANNPLIAHVADIEQISQLTCEITESAHKLILAFFPGPLTIVLRKRSEVLEIATAGLGTIGIRMPRLEIARQFLAACGTAVVAPSANLSGRPSPTTWQSVLEDLDGRIDCILQSEASEIGVESTVVDCTAHIPLVLRSGSVYLDQLQSVIPETSLYHTSENEAPKSPGLRHRHYSPRAQVILAANVRDLVYEPKVSFIGISQPSVRFDQELICSNVDAMAQALFEFFRESDREGISKIICESVEPSGIGMALMDRVRRAAEN